MSHAVSINGQHRPMILLLLVIAGCALGGAWIAHLHLPPVPGASRESAHSIVDHAFAQAARASSQRDYSRARRLWQQVLIASPLLPEAWTNLGFSSLGLGHTDEARRQFSRALAIRPGQANAYYGLALASEAAGDRPAALGAMRTFVHLAAPDDPFVRRARAALWEWQS